MKLTELEPQFLESKNPVTDHYVDKIEEAQGIIFLCPKCFLENKGSKGTHSVICWNPTVPQDRNPKPGRWNLVGTGYDDLSLVNGSSSVALNGGCNAHFYVKNGEIIML